MSLPARLAVAAQEPRARQSGPGDFKSREFVRREIERKAAKLGLQPSDIEDAYGYAYSRQRSVRDGRMYSPIESEAAVKSEFAVPFKVLVDTLEQMDDDTGRGHMRAFRGRVQELRAARGSEVRYARAEEDVTPESVFRYAGRARVQVESPLVTEEVGTTLKEAAHDVATGVSRGLYRSMAAIGETDPQELARIKAEEPQGVAGAVTDFVGGTVAQPLDLLEIADFLADPDYRKKVNPEGTSAKDILGAVAKGWVYVGLPGAGKAVGALKAVGVGNRLARPLIVASELKKAVRSGALDAEQLATAMVRKGVAAESAAQAAPRMIETLAGASVDDLTRVFEDVAEPAQKKASAGSAESVEGGSEGVRAVADSAKNPARLDPFSDDYDEALDKAVQDHLGIGEEFVPGAGTALMEEYSVANQRVVQRATDYETTHLTEDAYALFSNTRAKVTHKGLPTKVDPGQDWVTYRKRNGKWQPDARVTYLFSDITREDLSHDLLLELAAFADAHPVMGDVAFVPLSSYRESRAKFGMRSASKPPGMRRASEIILSQGDEIVKGVRVPGVVLRDYAKKLRAEAKALELKGVTIYQDLAKELGVTREELDNILNFSQRAEEAAIADSGVGAASSEGALSSVAAAEGPESGSARRLTTQSAADRADLAEEIASDIAHAETYIEGKSQRIEDYVVLDATPGKRRWRVNPEAPDLETASALRHLYERQDALEAMGVRQREQLAQDVARDIKDFVSGVVANTGSSKRLILPRVSKDVAKKINEALGKGDVTGFRHSIDADGVRHALNRHSDTAIERSRGQLPLSPADIEKYPEIVSAPDSIIPNSEAHSPEAYVYVKRYNGTTYVVEESRVGREQLAFKSMWKVPSEKELGPTARITPSGDVSSHTSKTFHGLTDIIGDSGVKPKDSEASDVISQAVDEAKRQYGGGFGSKQTGAARISPIVTIDDYLQGLADVSKKRAESGELRAAEIIKGAPRYLTEIPRDTIKRLAPKVTPLTDRYRARADSVRAKAEMPVEQWVKTNQGSVGAAGRRAKRYREEVGQKMLEGRWKELTEKERGLAKAYAAQRKYQREQAYEAGAWVRDSVGGRIRTPRPGMHIEFEYNGEKIDGRIGHVDETGAVVVDSTIGEHVLRPGSTGYVSMRKPDPLAGWMKGVEVEMDVSDVRAMADDPTNRQFVENFRARSSDKRDKLYMTAEAKGGMRTTSTQPELVRGTVKSVTNDSMLVETPYGDVRLREGTEFRRPIQLPDEELRRSLKKHGLFPKWSSEIEKGGGAELEAEIKHQIDTGQARTEKEALRNLKRIVRYQGKYMQHSTLRMPRSMPKLRPGNYETDVWVLSQEEARRASMDIAATEVFGEDLWRLQDAIADFEIHKGTAETLDLRRAVANQLDVGEELGPRTTEGYGASAMRAATQIEGAVSAGRLINPLKLMVEQPSQLANLFADTTFEGFVKGSGQYALSRTERRLARESGVTGSKILRDYGNVRGVPGWMRLPLDFYFVGAQKFDEGLRTLGVVAFKASVESEVGRLKPITKTILEGGNKREVAGFVEDRHYRWLTDRIGMTDDDLMRIRAEGLTEMDALRAAQGSRRNQISGIAQEMPAWVSERPDGRMWSRLLNFPFNQSKVFTAMLREARHGNFTPLVKFYFGSAVVAEGTLTAKARVKDLLDAWGDELDGEDEAGIANTIAAILGEGDHAQEFGGKRAEFLSQLSERHLLAVIERANASLLEVGTLGFWQSALPHERLPGGFANAPVGSGLSNARDALYDGAAKAYDDAHAAEGAAGKAEAVYEAGKWAIRELVRRTTTVGKGLIEKEEKKSGGLW